MMQIGVVFPQTEIGAAVADVRRYATAVEELGFAHLLAYDHVLGADPEAHAPWHGPYDVTRRSTSRSCCSATWPRARGSSWSPGVIILPQRQTALVAKQAAEVDLLTDGRFRLGVGLGWNAVEYEALGESFGDRGRRMSEQIPLLRRLLSEPVVTHDGELRPDHGRRPGAAARCSGRSRSGSAAQSPPAYRRIGRLADGWFPQVPPGPKLDEAKAIVAEAALGARARPGDDRDGGPGQLVRRRHRQRSSTTSAAGATPARRTCRSTR